ncbi:MAG TPA: hypothetical protein VIO60_01040 [Rectinemataceae bacterium]
MKRYLAVFILVSLALSAVLAQPSGYVYTPALRKDARSMGSGGASLLFSTDYDSFFGNPAGFTGPGSLTLGDLSLWSYVPVTPASINKLQQILEVGMEEADFEAAVDKFIKDNSELGFGGALGLGWAGKGFGLGFTMVSEARLAGYDFANSAVHVANQLNAIVGFGLPINLGFIKIALGADVRGFYRMDSEVAGWTEGHDLVMSYFGYRDDGELLLADNVLYGGFGYALDAGATLRIGPLMAGFMARDLFANLNVDYTTVQAIVEDADYPVEGGDPVAIEPTYTAGLALKFNENGYFSPSLYAETDGVEDLIADLKAGTFTSDSLLASMRVGGEIRLLRIFVLRGGLNKNCLSFGAGIDLHLISADVAVFNEDIQDLNSRSGLALRAAIKF